MTFDMSDEYSVLMSAVVERDQVAEAHDVGVVLHPAIHLPELDVADAVVDVLEPDVRRLVARRHRPEARKERAADSSGARRASGSVSPYVPIAAITTSPSSSRTTRGSCIGIAPRSTAVVVRVARVVDPERIVLHAVAVLVHVRRDRRARGSAASSARAGSCPAASGSSPDRARPSRGRGTRRAGSRTPTR